MHTITNEEFNLLEAAKAYAGFRERKEGVLWLVQHYNKAYSEYLESIKPKSCLPKDPSKSGYHWVKIWNNDHFEPKVCFWKKIGQVWSFGGIHADPEIMHSYGYIYDKPVEY